MTLNFNPEEQDIFEKMVGLIRGERASEPIAQEEFLRLFPKLSSVNLRKIYRFVLQTQRTDLFRQMLTLSNDVRTSSEFFHDLLRFGTPQFFLIFQELFPGVVSGTEKLLETACRAQNRSLIDFFIERGIGITPDIIFLLLRQGEFETALTMLLHRSEFSLSQIGILYLQNCKASTNVLEFFKGQKIQLNWREVYNRGMTETTKLWLFENFCPDPQDALNFLVDEPNCEFLILKMLRKGAVIPMGYPRLNEYFVNAGPLEVRAIAR